jgi:hypothetical protein
VVAKSGGIGLVGGGGWGGIRRDLAWLIRRGEAWISGRDYLRRGVSCLV